MITQEELIDMFDYVDGKLMKNGSEFGWMGDRGYHRTKVEGKSYQSHRLIYLYHHGYIPKFVDHINRKREDNHIENLRGCTQSQNSRNALKRRDGVSKYRGVSKHRNKWKACIRLNYKQHYLGVYDSEDAAALAYDIALLAIDPEFGNFNFPKENYNRKT